MGLGELLAGPPYTATRIRKYRKDEVTAHVEELIGFLEHGSAEVRGEAALALGRGNCEEAVPALVARLGDPGKNVALWSAESLGKIGHPDAVGPLSQLLKSEQWIDRGYAVQALARINHRSAVPALIRALEDERHAVYADAREALKRLIQPEDLPALEEVTERVSPRRRRALRRLIARAR